MWPNWDSERRAFHLPCERSTNELPSHMGKLLHLHSCLKSLTIHINQESGSFWPGSFRPILGVGRFGHGRWVVSANFLGESFRPKYMEIFRKVITQR